MDLEGVGVKKVLDARIHVIRVKDPKRKGLLKGWREKQCGVGMEKKMENLTCCEGIETWRRIEIGKLNWEIEEMRSWTCCEWMQGKGPVHPGPLDLWWSLEQFNQLSNFSNYQTYTSTISLKLTWNIAFIMITNPPIIQSTNQTKNRTINRPTWNIAFMM